MDEVHSSAAESRTIDATPVMGAARGTFLSRMFGAGLTLAGEFSVYDWMANVCPAYRGGFWNFYELSNGGFYMAPEVVGGRDKLHLVVRTNDFEGELSPDAAGIVATLFAINHGANHLHDAFCKLQEFAYGHAEAGLILRAID